MNKTGDSPSGFHRFIYILENVLRLTACLALALLLLYPVLPALFFDAANLGDGVGVFSFWLQRLDAGGEMGLGPWVLRALALAVVALPGIFPSFEFSLPRRLVLPLFFFYALSFVSACHCSHPYEALMTVLDAVLVTGIALRTSQLLDEFLISTFLSFLPIVVLFQIPSLFKQYCLLPAPDGQMRGAFHHPNMLASYFLLAAPLILLRALAPDPPGLINKGMWFHWRRSAYFVLLACLLATIVLSGSRAALLFGLGPLLAVAVFWLPKLEQATLSIWKDLVVPAGQAAALVIVSLGGWALATRVHLAALSWLFAALYGSVLLYKIGLYCRPRVWQSVLCLVAAAMLVIGARELKAYYNPHQDDVSDARVSQIVQGEDTSVQARLVFWEGGWLEACEYPLLGVGPAGYHRYYPQYQTDCLWFSKFPHSLALGVLCENGWPAFLILAIAAAIGLVLTIQRLSSDPPSYRLCRASALLGVIGLQIVSSLDVQWQFPMFPLTMGFLLGCCWWSAAPLSPPVSGVEESLEEPSPWLIRPHVILNQFTCALLLGLQIINLWGGEGELFHQFSKSAMQQRKQKEAVLLSRRAIDLNPWQGEFYHQLGLALLSNPAPSEEDSKLLSLAASSACRLDSHRAVHFDLLSKVELLQKHMDKAEAAGRMAISLDDMNYPSFYSNLAQMRLQNNDVQSARLILEAATARFPVAMLEKVFDFRAETLRHQMSEVYSQLAELNEPQLHPKESAHLYEQALKLDKDSYSAHVGLGVCLYKQGFYAQVIPELEFANAQESDVAVIYAILADCYRHQGRVKDAAEADKKFETLKHKDAAK